MKLKIQRPRSCLGWFAWIFGILLLIFALGNVYAQVRMAQVTQDIASLARNLGYTPEEHLYHETGIRDTNLITGSSYCVFKFYYTTPMSVAEFTDRLNQVLPETQDIWRVEENNTTLYTILDLTVNGIETWRGQNFLNREPITLYYWPLSKRNAESIDLYETADLKSTIEYKGNRIKGNTVKLYANAGIFPIWMWCPYTSSDAPEIPFD
jgi:hypothetical protein